jgi:hypothetical protein
MLYLQPVPAPGSAWMYIGLDGVDSKLSQQVANVDLQDIHTIIIFVPDLAKQLTMCDDFPRVSH